MEIIIYMFWFFTFVFIAMGIVSFLSLLPNIVQRFSSEKHTEPNIINVDDLIANLNYLVEESCYYVKKDQLYQQLVDIAKRFDGLVWVKDTADARAVVVDELNTLTYHEIHLLKEIVRVVEKGISIQQPEIKAQLQLVIPALQKKYSEYVQQQLLPLQNESNIYRYTKRH